MFKNLLIGHLIFRLEFKKLVVLDLQVLKAAITDDPVVTVSFSLNGTMILRYF